MTRGRRLSAMLHRDYTEPFSLLDVILVQVETDIMLTFVYRTYT